MDAVVIVVEVLDGAGAVQWSDQASVTDGDTLRVGPRGFVGLVAAQQPGEATAADDDGDVCGCAVCRAQRSPHAAEELERPLVRELERAWRAIDALLVRVAELERQADGRG